jgi:hypothetical protein
VPHSAPLSRGLGPQTYSWAGFGNLGDDWIAEVAAQRLGVTSISERRCVSLSCLGRYGLGPHAHEGRGAPLLLWGGGWLAADRPESTTLDRWSHNLRRYRGKARAFGLGIGPFPDLTAHDERRLAEIFDQITGPVLVRSPSDLFNLPSGIQGQVAADVTLLDHRFQSGCESFASIARAEQAPYIAVSLPRYSQHWRDERPWIDEQWYRHWVRKCVMQRQANERIVFVEFDNGGRSTALGDADYWSDLTQEVVRPTTIIEAAEVFGQAQWAFAGRLHAGILATLMRVPVLAFAYHHKFEVLSELGVTVCGLSERPNGGELPSVVAELALQSVRVRAETALDAMSLALIEDQVDV